MVVGEDCLKPGYKPDSQQFTLSLILYLYKQLNHPLSHCGDLGAEQGVERLLSSQRALGIPDTPGGPRQFSNQPVLP